MAKVEGSNPFIRFIESPGDPGLSCVQGLLADETQGVVLTVPLQTTSLAPWYPA